jgi:hypothetical protein
MGFRKLQREVITVAPERVKRRIGVLPTRRERDKSKDPHRKRKHKGADDG